MTNIAPLPERPGLDQHALALELVRLFQQAEEKIKLVEKLSQELSIPAINELRYAGYHMTQYLSGNADAETELTKAQNHCKRAIYDAVEAGVTRQLELIKQFQDDFRLISLSEAIPGYKDIQKQIKGARDLILTPRDSKQDRAEYYEQCSTHLENLRVAHDDLELYREDLLKRLKRSNRDNRLLLATLIATVIGATFTVLSFYKPQSDIPTAPPVDMASAAVPTPQAAK